MILKRLRLCNLSLVFDGLFDCLGPEKLGIKRVTPGLFGLKDRVDTDVY